VAKIVRRLVYTADPPVTIGDHQVGLAFNATNLRLVGNALDTIQDIHEEATPTFVGIQNTASALQLNAGADQDVTLFANAGSGQNPGLLLYGYITAASGARYYRVGVDDVNDEVLWSVQDSYINGFAFQLPDNAGATALRVRDSDAAEVFSVDSDGVLILGGSAGTQYISFWHDGTNGNIATGSGDINLSPAGLRTNVYSFLRIYRQGYTEYADIIRGQAALQVKVSNNGTLQLLRDSGTSPLEIFLGTTGNPKVSTYGYITAASATRAFYCQVDDTNDEVLWTAQDSYITGFCFKLPDNAGGTEWRIRDSDGAIVASINSDGMLEVRGDIDIHDHVDAIRIGRRFIKGQKYSRIDLNPTVHIYSDTGTHSDLNLGTSSGGLGINIHGGTAYVTLGANPDSPPSRLTLKGGTTAAEGISFGNGSGTYDTNLYRSAADTLKTDDKFIASSAQFGTDTDYLAIAEDGELTLVGDSRVRGFMRLDPKRFKIPAANYPGETFEGIFYTLDFDDSTEESAYAEVEIPCDWDNTTDISVSVYWFHDNADNGAVKWGLEYRAIKCGETVSDATTTITETSAGNHAAGELVCTTFTTGIAAADLERGDELAIRLYRDADDAADTLGEDARVIAVQFCYTKNRLGEPVL